MNDSFDLDALKEKTFVRQVVYLPSVASTNDVALQIARRGDQPMPLLVLTDEQTAGRGRGTNRWWSSSGALTFSVIVAAHEVPPELLPQVSLTAALAVIGGVQPRVGSGCLGLKWPNDVYLDGRKLAGILIECVASAASRLVIGIGINVNNHFEQAPEEVARRAISLAGHAGQPQSRQDVLEDVLAELSRYLERWWARDSGLVDEWQRYCVLRGRIVQLDTYGRRVVGYCEGIDEAGGLVVHSEAGPARYLGGVVENVY